jgi:hypothetical protein
VDKFTYRYDWGLNSKLSERGQCVLSQDHQISSEIAAVFSIFCVKILSILWSLTYLLENADGNSPLLLSSPLRDFKSQCRRNWKAHVKIISSDRITKIAGK